MPRPSTGPTTFVVSRFSNPAFIYKSGTIYHGEIFPTNDEIRANAAANLGGLPSDYAVIWNSEPSTINRILQGHDHSVSWDGIDENIDAIYDFTNENAKWILRAVASANNVLADNTSTVNITFQARKQSDNTIDPNINGNFIIPIDSPTGTRYVRITFAAGSAVITFKAPAIQSGDWFFPSRTFAENNAKLDSVSVARVRAFVTAF